MGALLSYFFGSTDTTVDPSTGLTNTQRDLIRQCWKSLQPNIRDIGVEIMITYFKEYPKYQDEFEKFRGKDLEELANNRTFHAHCIGIMGTFDQAIEFLHDPELCVAGLHLTGHRHANRGQQVEAFDALEPIVHRIIKNRLGPRWTPDVSEAFDIALALIFTEIKKSVEEFHRKQQNYQGASTTNN